MIFSTFGENSAVSIFANQGHKSSFNHLSQKILYWPVQIIPFSVHHSSQGTAGSLDRYFRILLVKQAQFRVWHINASAVVNKHHSNIRSLAFDIWQNLSSMPPIVIAYSIRRFVPFVRNLFERNPAVFGLEFLFQLIKGWKIEPEEEALVAFKEGDDPSGLRLWVLDIEFVDCWHTRKWSCRFRCQRVLRWFEGLWQLLVKHLCSRL